MDEIKAIRIEDENYPKILKKIKNPPKALYYRGEIKGEEDKSSSSPTTPLRGVRKSESSFDFAAAWENDEKCFAVVGTRRFSLYGKQVTLEIAGDLAEAGLTIVSGLAPGIDTFAHTAALERNQRTIAVLGTGVDKKSIYPKENIKLAEKILKTGGVLISEYPPGTPGSKFSFPQRNRIISGLSLGVLVIEAKQKSGALITAYHAFEQNRKVFAVPGQIHSSNSKGCHLLIKQGAKLVDSANDILKELNLSLAVSNTAKPIAGESPEENLILEILGKESLYIDKIIEKTKLPAPAAVSTLVVLEIKGKVKNLGNNTYAVNHR